MSLTILLVDDNAVFINAMRHLLAQVRGVSVIAQAMDGLEALVTFDQMQPDLVLTDISMPVMTGFELAAILRVRPKPPTIVFLSAHDDDHYANRAKELGALGLINKADVVERLLPLLQSLGTTC